MIIPPILIVFGNFPTRIGLLIGSIVFVFFVYEHVKGQFTILFLSEFHSTIFYLRQQISLKSLLNFLMYFFQLLLILGDYQQLFLGLLL